MSIAIEKNGPVTTIILDRPQARNAVDRPTAEVLAEAFRQFDEDEEALVAVFYGANGTFCAGADLKALADESRRNRISAEGDGPMGPSRMLLSKPVIGAISGYAVAGGLELALWCDLRIVEEDAVFGVFCRRWGVPLIDGGTVRLPRIIGLGRAMDLILSGRAIAADEAYVMGLANRIVARGSARKEAEALAHEMAQFPQHCLRNDRLSVYEQQGLTLEDALKNEFERSVESLQVDGLKGAAQFAQGRGRHGVFGKL